MMRPGRFATILPSELRWVVGVSPKNGDPVEVDREAFPSAGRIFYGPYLRLPKGVYFFRFEGALSGPLAIDLSHRAGHVLKWAIIESFEAAICLSLPCDCLDFEVRGSATPEFGSFTLREIAVERTPL